MRGGYWILVQNQAILGSSVQHCNPGPKVSKRPEGAKIIKEDCPAEGQLAGLSGEEIE